ncbi:nucleoside deaminase [Nocardia otitidiscaviarum]|nr:nucleoside deaminase [Nocardia otitidiscaviarum]
MMTSESELAHLRRCVELAAAALDDGDNPFGSVLVSADGEVLAEDRNRETTARDPMAHPEITLARWAAARLTPVERAGATVFTSGEHCPMCSAAHAWAGIGRIVYVASAAQFAAWTAEFGGPESPVAPLPVRQVAPGVLVEGPVPELTDAVRELHRRRFATR